MTNIILVGYGKMGKLIAETIDRADDLRIIGIVDTIDPEQARSFDEIDTVADVVMDFSYPGNLSMTLSYVLEKGCALVLGTTGLTVDQTAQVNEASTQVPIVFSYNYSLGIAVLKRALSLVAPALIDDFDIEIIEAHHRQKVDAPSGTAKLLKDAIDPNGEMLAVAGRSGIVGARTKKEIGMHAVRGGTVAGEHSVLFLGDQESISFKHAANNRQIFVNGAVKAARFVAGKPAGMYTIDNVLFG